MASTDTLWNVHDDNSEIVNGWVIIGGDVNNAGWSGVNTWLRLNTKPTATPCDLMAVNLNSIDHTSCGKADGAINISVNGAGTPFSYNWNTGATTDTLMNLTGGSYTITVTNGDASCIKSFDYIVNGSSSITLTVAPSLDSCTAVTGNMSANITGGSTPYSYTWNTGATTWMITGLSAGTYVVTVSDDEGCWKAGNSDMAGMLAVTTTPTNDVCDEGIGAVINSIVGGSVPYTFSWNTGATTWNLTGLAPGIYAATITDAGNCWVTVSETITGTTGVNITLTGTDSNCGVSDGSITVTVAGGNTVYNYNWSGSASGQTTNVATGLGIGVYWITVTDNGNGCATSAMANIGNIGAPTLSVSTTDVLCNGEATGSIATGLTGGTTPFTYSWSVPQTSWQVTGLMAGQYSVTVEDGVNCLVLAWATITEPSALSLTFDQTNLTCAGSNDGIAEAWVDGGVSPYNYLWNNVATTWAISGLGSGTASVTVTDQNGCWLTGSAIILEPSAVTATATSTNILCAGDATGSATGLASGGTTPYSYSWNNAVNTAANNNIIAGTYVMDVTDANGCPSNSATVIITEPANVVSLTLTSTEVTSAGLDDGTVTAVIAGGTTPYAYAWSTTPPAVTLNVTGLAGGSYTIAGTDANGCSFGSSVSVGISNIAELGNKAMLFIYPNPTENGFTLSATGLPIGSYTISISNMLGEIMKQEKLDVNGTISKTYDVSNYKTGVYFVKIANENNSVTRKVIVE